ncbi:alcohol dehydrogenase-like 5 [Olea europaea var. sylvestris]|uniref:alcohol dehydrogenase-like 5 n=1 Tax=Olea europaea var. sylvestris TaxID=158386 RepID=UPI000C1CE576|nr:alcohol dehydrogenase-like 5 [Olea europaea var. sylvestris]
MVLQNKELITQPRHNQKKVTGSFRDCLQRLFSLNRKCSPLAHILFSALLVLFIATDQEIYKKWTEFINPKDSDKPVSELIKETTCGLGVDYCYECTGVPELLNEAIEGSKVGLVTIVFIGAGLHLSGELKYIPLLCGRTIKGSIYGGVRPQIDFLKIVEKCINKEIQLDELLTHEVSLEEINKAWKYLKHPSCVKVVIKY